MSSVLQKDPRIHPIYLGTITGREALPRLKYNYHGILPHVPTSITLRPLSEVSYSDT